MRRSAVPLAALALLAAGCATRPPPPPAPRPELRYYVKPASQNPSLLAVTLVVENIRSDSLELTFPVWLPGDFRPIEPGKWVEDVRAYDRATAELPVRRLGPNLWRVYPRAAPYFLVSYTLHPVRPDGFKRSSISELTATGGFFTGAVAFGYLKGLENYPLSVTFELGSRTPVVCTLEEKDPGRYVAEGAFELAQAGCAYGTRMRELRENVGGVRHRLVLVAPPAFATDSLMRVLQDVTAAQELLFPRPPYPEYTFFVHFVDRAEVGLGASPLLRGSAYYLPEIHPDRIRSSEIPYLLAHQLFHARNLWLFPPAELDRPPLDKPVTARGLWLVEGLAEHYARVLLARGRVLPRAEIYAAISHDIGALEVRPEAARTNLETASVGATHRADRDVLDPLALKSPLAALALDVQLRRSTGNAFGADSLLRWLEGGAAGPRVVPYDSIVSWVVRLGGPPVRSLYTGAIAGSQNLPYAEILAAAGLELATSEVEELNLGASLLPDGGGGFVFRNVDPNGIGGRMGLRSGDRLLSVNHQPVSPHNLFPLLAVLADLRSGLRVGKPLAISVQRGGTKLDLTGSLAPWTRKVKTVVESERASPAATALREAIFGGERGSAPGG